MTTLVRIIITIIITVLFSSCGFDLNLGSGQRGNGVIQEETRAISSEFSKVFISEGLEAYVSQGSRFQIIVEADENIIPLIVTDVENNTLRIYAIKNIGHATKKVHVSLPQVTGLESSSGAILYTENTITSDHISLHASSGSNLKIEALNANNISANTSSGAHINVAGNTHTLNCNASSGSNINATNLFAKQCNANASSAANISLNVSESLTAEVSSAAHIKYTGNAQTTEKKSSAGNISKL